MYFCEAINKFNQITHYRGIYMTLKDIHDLEQKNIIEEKVSPKANAKEIFWNALGDGK